MVKKVTFVGFRGGDRPNRPPRIAPDIEIVTSAFAGKFYEQMWFSSKIKVWNVT